LCGTDDRARRPEIRSNASRRDREIDVLACPECGGRLRPLATIEDPAVVKKILSHLGIATECPRPAPARSPPETAGVFEFEGG
jgi:hypothetical protein